MEQTIRNIMSELGEEVFSIKEIVGLGSVNKVFDVNDNYIIRLNDESQKAIEYKKETWCIDKVSSIGIPSPKAIKLGLKNGFVYMIQNKISGVNGKNCSSSDKYLIWENLGSYASNFHRIEKIEEKAVEDNEFHASWKHRLDYNIGQLNKNDSLLNNGILDSEEHNNAKAELSKLKNIDVKSGLIHGDLCPRNVIFNDSGTFLIDWGLAEINVVPHIELGIVMTSGEANPEEIEAFKKGYGITQLEFEKMEPEINLFNLLHRLDKYRWAEEHDVENIHDYEQKSEKLIGNYTNNELVY